MREGINFPSWHFASAETQGELGWGMLMEAKCVRGASTHACRASPLGVSLPLSPPGAGVVAPFVLVNSWGSESSISLQFRAGQGLSG